MIELSPRAVEVLGRAATAAKRFDPNARVRIRTDPAGVSFELADAPEPGDETIDHPSGFSILVEAGLAGLIDVEEPHDRLVLRSSFQSP